MSVARRGIRSQARQLALQALYAADVAHRGEDSLTHAAVEAALAGLASHFELAEGAWAYARSLALGVADDRATLDEAITAHATNWRIDRMAVVDRNVLRIGVYELTRLALPTSVAIDEAVELARRFGGDSSPAFVNGVLDAVARSLDAGAAPRVPLGEEAPGL